MTLVDVEKIQARPEIEGERTEFPAGFPDPIDVPATRYTDETFFELERHHIFGRSWLYAGHVDQVPEPGDYVRLDAFREPLMLVRGVDGAIRCFYNSCQHRGSPLVQDKAGNKRLLICPYHGWTYETGGSLRGYPEAKNFPANTDRSCLNLRSVRCETYGPLVFINLSGTAGGLREFLGPIADEIDMLIGDRAVDVHLVAEEQQTIRANWKLAGDANVETYHVPYLHSETAGPVLDTARTAQWLLRNGHSRMFIKYKREMAPTLKKGVGLPRFKGLHANDLPLQGVYSFHLFPNTSIVLGSGEMFFVIAAVPRSVNEFEYLVHYMSPEPKGGPNHDLIQKLVAFNSRVLNEDLAVLPGIQASMESGGLERLKLQYQERRIRRLHEEIDRAIGTENVPTSLRVVPLLDAYVEER